MTRAVVLNRVRCDMVQAAIVLLVFAILLPPLIMLALALVAFWRTDDYELRQRRIDAGQCAECGYDLRETPDRCPECGAPTGRER